jgi:hypothetical protein
MSAVDAFFLNHKCLCTRVVCPCWSFWFTVNSAVHQPRTYLPSRELFWGEVHCDTALTLLEHNSILGASISCFHYGIVEG